MSFIRNLQRSFSAFYRFFPRFTSYISSILKPFSNNQFSETSVYFCNNLFFFYQNEFVIDIKTNFYFKKETLWLSYKILPLLKVYSLILNFSSETSGPKYKITG